jgi:hypothetical protein
VAIRDQAWGELVKDVRGVPRAGQQDNGPARSAPVQDLEFYILINVDELSFVG